MTSIYNISNIVQISLFVINMYSFIAENLNLPLPEKFLVQVLILLVHLVLKLIYIWKEFWLILGKIT